MCVVRLTTSLFLFIFIIQCHGIPRFANYIQDHMVLQRAPQKSIIWGFGEASTLTTLTMNNKTYTTMSRSEPANAQNESIWSVTLDPISDEGPFDIHVSQPLANGTLVTITLHDVLFGDVWICSGQSNMELTVSLIRNASEEIANAGNFPKIRLFTAALKPSLTPLDELPGIILNWSIASPQSVGGPDWQHMSAICWLYGRQIHQALGGRPIGLIATSYGGTVIELWMPPKALKECNTTENESVAIQPYEKPSTMVTINHSNLFNAMIYPFTRIVIYGSIWYQGEANRDYNTDKYTCSLSKMIENWREIWHERTNNITNIQFSFGVVQLSTFATNSDFIGAYPRIRWHQTFDIGHLPNKVVPNVFGAVTCDLRDDPNGDHPRYKHDVGYRLSRSGLAVAYEQKVEFLGPIIENIVYSSGSPTINITYTAVSSIDLRSPHGFEVCCEGSKCLNESIWIPSTISNKNGLIITIAVNSSCIGQQLYGFRYLWRETPCPFKGAALYSSTDPNLPSPPYLKIF